MIMCRTFDGAFNLVGGVACLAKNPAKKGYRRLADRYRPFLLLMTETRS